MSNPHVDLARGVQLPTGPKIVLLLVASHACGQCGLTWVGVARLAEESGLSERTVQDALKQLKTLGLLKVRAYEHGGRGRSTEYVVMPESFAELSTPPCGKCLENMKPRSTRTLSP